MEITKAISEKTLITILSKKWEMTFDKIIEHFNNGDIFVFTKKGVFDFYLEAELDPNQALKADLKDKSVIQIGDLFFMC